jgi:hypothetical protein
MMHATYALHSRSALNIGFLEGFEEFKPRSRVVGRHAVDAESPANCGEPRAILAGADLHSGPVNTRKPLCANRQLPTIIMCVRSKQ